VKLGSIRLSGLGFQSKGRTLFGVSSFIALPPS
jgi:hypothetical protein